MKRAWKILVLWLMCGILFSGCEKKETGETAVVTGIQVTCCHDGQTMARTYTHPEKVRRFLYYLRRKTTAGYASCDPERRMGDMAWVRVELSDGESRVYRILADRFLSVDCHRWKNVDPSWGRRLYYLLLLIPPDAVANPAGG